MLRITVVLQPDKFIAKVFHQRLQQFIQFFNAQNNVSGHKKGAHTPPTISPGIFRNLPTHAHLGGCDSIISLHYPIVGTNHRFQPVVQKRALPDPQLILVAGAGFEPATFGL